MLISSSFYIPPNSADDKIQPIKNNPELIEINLTNMEPVRVLYSDLFSSIEYVPLETTSESLIGQITQIKIINDTIYVFDKTIAKCLFIFDHKGKFIRKIGNIGKGPGEYVALGNFSINNKDNTISFFDRAQQKIVVYGKDGVFAYEIKLKMSEIIGTRISTNNKGNYYVETKLSWSKNPKSVLKLINNKGTILKRWFSFPSFNKGWDITLSYTAKSFCSIGEDIRYYNYFNDTIFSFSNDEAYPFLAIKSPNPLTQNDVQRYKKSVIKTNSPSSIELRKIGKYFGINNYLENNSMIMFMYNKGFRGYTILVEKHSRQYKLALLKDDMTNINRLGQFCECTNNYFIKPIRSWGDFLSLKDNIKKGKAIVSQSDKIALGRVKMEDNPVLVLFKLKK